MVQKIGFLNTKRRVVSVIVRQPGVFGDAIIKQEGVRVPVDPSIVRWFLKTGTELRPTVIERFDGARVMMTAESYNERDFRERGITYMGSRKWIAFAPGGTSSLRSKPMGKCSKGSGGGGYRASGNRRRWGTYEAAIKAMDLEFPYEARP